MGWEGVRLQPGGSISYGSSVVCGNGWVGWANEIGANEDDILVVREYILQSVAEYFTECNYACCVLIGYDAIARKYTIPETKWHIQDGRH